MTPIQIKRGRNYLGLTQGEFAQLMGVQRSTVCSWEKGYKKPQPKSLEKLEYFLMKKWKFLTLEQVENAAAPYLDKNFRITAWGSFANAIEAQCLLNNL